MNTQFSQHLSEDTHLSKRSRYDVNSLLSPLSMAQQNGFGHSLTFSQLLAHSQALSQSQQFASEETENSATSADNNGVSHNSGANHQSSNNQQLVMQQLQLMQFQQQQRLALQHLALTGAVTSQHQQQQQQQQHHQQQQQQPQVNGLGQLEEIMKLASSGLHSGLASAGLAPGLGNGLTAALPNGLSNIASLLQQSSYSSLHDIQPKSEAHDDTTNVLYSFGLCRWPGCETPCDSHDTFHRHLVTVHTLDDRSTAQARVQMQVVSQLERQQALEKARLHSMLHHLHFGQKQATAAAVADIRRNISDTWAMKQEAEVLGASPHDSGSAPALPLARSQSDLSGLVSGMVEQAHLTQLPEMVMSQKCHSSVKRRNSDRPSLPTICAELSADMEKNREFYQTHDVRPPYTYASLIRQAVMESANHQLTLNEIYQWFIATFAYFRRNEATWKNAVRHNLSLHKCFMRVENVKGAVWTVDDNEFYKRRTSRQTGSPGLPTMVSQPTGEEVAPDHNSLSQLGLLSALIQEAKAQAAGSPPSQIKMEAEDAGQTMFPQPVISQAEAAECLVALRVHSDTTAGEGQQQPEHCLAGELTVSSGDLQICESSRNVGSLPTPSTSTASPDSLSSHYRENGDMRDVNDAPSWENVTLKLPGVSSFNTASGTSSFCSPINLLSHRLSPHGEEVPAAEAEVCLNYEVVNTNSPYTVEIETSDKPSEFAMDCGSHLSSLKRKGISLERRIPSPVEPRVASSLEPRVVSQLVDAEPAATQLNSFYLSNSNIFSKGSTIHSPTVQRLPSPTTSTTSPTAAASLNTLQLEGKARTVSPGMPSPISPSTTVPHSTTSPNAAQSPTTAHSAVLTPAEYLLAHQHSPINILSYEEVETDSAPESKEGEPDVGHREASAEVGRVMASS